MSLRKIAAALTEAGHLNERGQPFNPSRWCAKEINVTIPLAVTAATWVLIVAALAGEPVP
jgi:hypothetical protein